MQATEPTWGVARGHLHHPSDTGHVHPLRPIRRLNEDAKENQDNKLTTRASNAMLEPKQVRPEQVRPEQVNLA